MNTRIRSFGMSDKGFKFLTIAEVAERLSVSTRTVRRWITAGTLQVHRFGRLVRVSETDLVAFLALNRDA